MNIIWLVAWVHQKTRDRDEESRIVATEDDFHKAIAMVGDSFARAWKSLTPTEEKVYEAITEHVAANLQKHGFKRSHVEAALEKMKVDVSSTAIKDSLRTLAGTGFLESDGKRGATGATYTIAKTANFIGSITLSVHSSISEKSAEPGLGKGNLMDGSQSVHSRPSSIEEECVMDNGREQTNRDSSINFAYLSRKVPNGRMDRKCEEEKKDPNIEYEYSEDS